MAQGNESDQEKTEQPTTQRREEFRKSGQVAQSREIGTILILLGVSVTLYFLSRQLLGVTMGMFEKTFEFDIQDAARDGNILLMFSKLGGTAFSMIAPVFLVALLMAIIASVGQIGFLFSWENVSPNLERINPLNGLGKIFNLRSLVEGVKSVFKIALLGGVGFLVLKDEIRSLPHLAQVPVGDLFIHIGNILFRLTMTVCIPMAILAVLDFMFQKWDLDKRMRMTKQEVKEEFKQREGDPLIKARIKRIQRDLAQKRMMTKVPKADVIITNPTHIAVALKYDRTSMAAPVLVAKGADRIAEKIKEIARANGVPVVENKPLARTIFKTMKIGHAIPKSLYNAVAEVLAYVYKVKGRIQQVAQEMARENPQSLGGV